MAAGGSWLSAAGRRGLCIGEHVAEPWWINMRFALQNEKYGVRLVATDAENARLAEVLHAWHGWQRGLDQARQDTGLADAEDKADVISAEMGDVFRQMLKLKPQTLDGLRALALAIVENCWSDEIPVLSDTAGARGIAVLISTLTGVPIEGDDDIEAAV
jgi:hypothetical protein